MLMIHSRSLRRLSAHSAGVAQTRLMSILDPGAVIFSQTIRLGSLSPGFSAFCADDFVAWAWARAGEPQSTLTATKAKQWRMASLPLGSSASYHLFVPAIM